jgi:enterochelin esterase family protein
VLADGSVMFRVAAPQAQSVQIDLCGTKYDMQRADDGAWTVTTKPQVPGILTDTHTFNKNFDVFFMTCGEQDPRIEYTRNIVKQMRDKSVEVRFNSYPGDHEWQVWRKSLHEFVQYLFK